MLPFSELSKDETEMEAQLLWRRRRYEYLTKTVKVMVVDEIEKIAESHFKESKFTGANVSEFFDVLYSHNRSLIVISNRALRDLKGIIPASMMDRLSELQQVPFLGESFRLKKKELEDKKSAAKIQRAKK